MITRPKISQNEWKTTEIGAFEVGIFAPFCCPDEHDPPDRVDVQQALRVVVDRRHRREERREVERVLVEAWEKEAARLAKSGRRGRRDGRARGAFLSAVAIARRFSKRPPSRTKKKTASPSRGPRAGRGRSSGRGGCG